MLLLGEGTSGESETSYSTLAWLQLDSIQLQDGMPQGCCTGSLPIRREFGTHLCSPSTRHCASTEGAVGKGIWRSGGQQTEPCLRGALQSSRVDSPEEGTGYLQMHTQ